MSLTKRLYNHIDADEPYLYELNPYQADIEWREFMEQEAANQKAKLNKDDADVGYHGLRSSDL